MCNYLVLTINTSHRRCEKPVANAMDRWCDEHIHALCSMLGCDSLAVMDAFETGQPVCGICRYKDLYNQKELFND